MINKIKDALALVLGLLSLYTGAFGVFPDMIQRSIHLAFILMIIYCTSKTERTKAKTILDMVLCSASAICLGYLAFNFSTIASKFGAINGFEVVIGIIGIILLLEATRRTIGMPIVYIALAFLAYGFWGQYLPGLLEHRVYSIDRIVSHLYYNTLGIFGTPLGASATFVMLFVMFGSFLEESGASQLFMELAIALTGRFRGGAAKVSVVSSALMGTISGSAVANVVTTGTFTIPMMKGTGYKAHFAGAVEAVASTGGQLMPPVMGAAAFIMAEITGISYIKIAAAAVVPALLYYGSLFAAVHFEAVKENLGKISTKEIPDLRKSITTRGHLILPLFILVGLLVKGFSPMFSVFYSIVSIVAVSWIRRDTRMGFGKILKAIRGGSYGCLIVATACATAGIVAGVISLTGLGIKMTSILTTLAGYNLFYALALTMLTCIILGMGLPTAPVYILVAALMAPALVRIGLPVIAAHMFVFYSAILSAITPPVAVAAFAAAGIADASPMRIGLTACRIGLVVFVIPFFFAYQPVLLAQGNLLNIIYAGLVALVGSIFVATGTIGYLIKSCNIMERLLLIASGLCLIDSRLITDLIGVVLVGIVIVLQIISVKRQSKSTAATVS